MSTEIQFDVALSFAGEDREYVQKVASILKGYNVRVFYDEDEQATMWGKDLGDFLDDIYRKRSEYVLMFISTHYANKEWTNHERKSALARAITERREYVLPARFDNTELPGLRNTVGYIDLSSKTPEDLAQLIVQKIGTPDSGSISEDVTAATKEDTNKFELQLSEFEEDADPFHTNILSQPHWRLVVRPTLFNPELLSTLPACREIVDSCRVRARNWEFPYVRNAELEYGNDWIGGKVKIPNHFEHWRLYQSGQLMQVSMFREEFWRKDCEQKAFHIPVPEEFTVQGYHDIAITIDVVLDVFQFAAAYASHGILAQGCEIGINMKGVMNHILFSWNRDVEFYGFYATSADSVGQYRQYSSKGIQERTTDLALDSSNQLFHRFGWFDAPMADMGKRLGHR